MEQVFAPRYEFRPKHPDNQPDAGFDYGENGYQPGQCNIGFNEQTGQCQIEIKGLVEPKTPEAERICREDLHEIVASFVQDKASLEHGLFDDIIMPQDLTIVRLGKIIRDKYPELDEHDQEAVRQQALAAFTLTQKGKAIANAPDGDHEAKANTALIDGVRKFITDVRELTVDLIDHINPFFEAYAILAKSLDENRLQQIAAIITAKRITIEPEEAKELARRALLFKKERGRPPKPQSPDPWEQYLAAGAQKYAEYKKAGKYD